MKLFGALVSFLALTSTMTPTASGAVNGGPLCSMRQQLQTFRIEGSFDKKAYRVGDVVRFSMHVSRPSDKHPTDGTDMPVAFPFRQSAQGVDAAVTLFINNELPVQGYGPPADEEGNTVVRVKLPSKARRGVYQANVLAWIKYPSANAACVDPEEYGFREYPDPFEVR